MTTGSLVVGAGTSAVTGIAAGTSGNVLTSNGTTWSSTALPVAPVAPCRAWVNFDGTGTVAIRASGNVSSITDLGVGEYYVNFTTAMVDVSYSPVAGNGNNAASNTSSNITQINSSSVLYFAHYEAGVVRDVAQLSLAIFR